MYPLDVSERSAQESATLYARQQNLDVEGRLVEAARSNPIAFGTLYERHVDGLYSYIYHRVGDRMEAEDLVGETFSRALARLPSYEWRGLPFSSWLYRIASNHITSYYRRGMRLVGGDALKRDAPWDLGPEQMLAGKEWSDDLQAAMRTLSADQHKVIELRFGQDLRYKEIGAVMQRSEGAVKALLHRTLRSLQRQLAANRNTRCATQSNEAKRA